MSEPSPDKAAWKVEASRVSSANCRKFHAYIDFADDVPDLRSPVPTGTGTEQARIFLRALFREGDRVAVATSIDTATILPAHKVNIKKASMPHGGWFRVNRLVVPAPTGRRGGVTDKDVACDYLLLELDDAERSAQMLFWSAAIHAGFPVVSLTDSGKKSFHALIRLEAGDAAEYKETAARIMALLTPILPDNSTKNPSRLSRLPGFIREDAASREQELVYLNPAAPVWSWDAPIVKKLEAFAPTAEPIPEAVLKGRKVRSALRDQPATEDGGALDKAWMKRLDRILHRRRFDLGKYAETAGWVLFSAEAVAGLEDKHFITCPWADCHTGGGDDDTRTDAYIYQRTGDARFRWGFHCSHDSCQDRKVLDVLELAQDEDDDLFAECLEPDREVEMDFEGIPDAPDDTPPAEDGSTPAPVKLTVPESLLVATPCDVDNVAIFRTLFKDKARFFHNEGEWALWDGQRWKRDETEGVVRMASAAAEMRIKAAGDDIDLCTKLKAAGANKAIAATLALARTKEPIASSSRDFDKDDYVVGCANGVLNLKTQTLSLAKPSDHITRQVGVGYLPLALCPRWLTFLTELFPAVKDLDVHEIPAFLGRWFGYCLTGGTRQDKILILHGAKGRNGKSTIVKVISRIFGDYGAVLREGFLSGKKFAASTDGPSPSMVGLLGRRLAFVNETGESVALDEAKVKTLTGGDDITARGMYSKKEITFPLTSKLVISTNHLPEVKGTDPAIWSRILMVDFTETFLGREDTELEDTLFSELDGIFAWMVRGCADYLKYGLQIPKAVLVTTSDYKNSEDKLLQFLQDCTVPGDADSRLPRADLYRVYEQWAKRNHVSPLWPNFKFTKKMIEKGYQHVMIHGHAVWVGLKCPEAVDSI